jgi:hypothetical protein
LQRGVVDDGVDPAQQSGSLLEMFKERAERTQ